MSRRRLADLALLCSGWAVLGLMAASAPVPLRVVATLAFVGFAPGLALRPRFSPHDRLEAYVFALAASLSLAVLVSVGLALAHVLSAWLGLTCLAGITSFAALLDLARPGAPPAGLPAAGR